MERRERIGGQKNDDSASGEIMTDEEAERTIIGVDVDSDISGATSEIEMEVKKKRGRPPGSKNKVKPNILIEKKKMEEYVGIFGKRGRVTRSPIVDKAGQGVSTAGKEVVKALVHLDERKASVVEGRTARHDITTEAIITGDEITHEGTEIIEVRNERASPQLIHEGVIGEINEVVGEMFKNLQENMMRSFLEVRRENQKMIKKETERIIQAM